MLYRSYNTAVLVLLASTVTSTPIPPPGHDLGLDQVINATHQHAQADHSHPIKSTLSHSLKQPTITVVQQHEPQVPVSQISKRDPKHKKPKDTEAAEAEPKPTQEKPTPKTAIPGKKDPTNPLAGLHPDPHGNGFYYDEEIKNTSTYIFRPYAMPEYEGTGASDVKPAKSIPIWEKCAIGRKRAVPAPVVRTKCFPVFPGNVGEDGQPEPVMESVPDDGPIAKRDIDVSKRAILDSRPMTALPVMPGIRRRDGKRGAVFDHTALPLHLGLPDPLRHPGFPALVKEYNETHVKKVVELEKVASAGVHLDMRPLNITGFAVPVLPALIREHIKTHDEKKRIKTNDEKIVVEMEKAHSARVNADMRPLNLAAFPVAFPATVPAFAREYIRTHGTRDNKKTIDAASELEKHPLAGVNLDMRPLNFTIPALPAVERQYIKNGGLNLTLPGFPAIAEQYVKTHEPKDEKKDKKKAADPTPGNGLPLPLPTKIGFEPQIHARGEAGVRDVTLRHGFDRVDKPHEHEQVRVGNHARAEDEKVADVDEMEDEEETRGYYDDGHWDPREDDAEDVEEED